MTRIAQHFRIAALTHEHAIAADRQIVIVDGDDDLVATARGTANSSASSARVRCLSTKLRLRMGDANSGFVQIPRYRRDPTRSDAG